MKKLLTAIAVVALALAVPSAASAFSLGDYTGGVTFDFVNWDVGTTYDADTSFEDGADGDADSFGLVRVDTIDALGGNPLWQSTAANESLQGWFYGLDDNTVDIGSDYSGTIESIGGYVDLYLVQGGQTLDPLAAPAPTTPMTGLSAPADQWNATDGELFLRLEFVPGVVSSQNSTYFQDITTITNPVFGTGQGYLSVVGGSHAALFDSNAYNDVFPNADFYFSDSFDDRGLTAEQQENGWTVFSDGKVTGKAVPEPATMMLLGVGLAGGALVRRRRS
ncbi:MAG: PEP-CTERM sorting domain-containing protein [Candidatus Omnitrophota bacterium]